MKALWHREGNWIPYFEILNMTEIALFTTFFQVFFLQTTYMNSKSTTFIAWVLQKITYTPWVVRGKRKVLRNTEYLLPALVCFLLCQPARNSLFQLSRNLSKFSWFQKQTTDSIKHKVLSDFAVIQKLIRGKENPKQICSQTWRQKMTYMWLIPQNNFLQRPLYE